MANLIFIDEGHKYQFNGEDVPSVSEITRFVSREVYGIVQQDILDRAAARGTAIHKATELLDKYNKAEVDSTITEYVKAYVAFRKEHEVEYEKIEESIYNEQLGYAGTIDRYGTIDGKKVLLDIKSSSRLQKVLYGAGQNLYRMALESKGIVVDEIWILHLQKDGTYKIVELEKDDEIANACLTLHKALAPKRRTKKNKEDKN